MMKRLLCAGLYYNMIMALSFRIGEFDESDEVDLVLENTGIDSDRIIQNVKNIGLFSNVYTYDIKSRISELEKKGKFGIILDKIKHYCFPRLCKGNFGFPLNFYDEYYGMNMEAPVRVSYMSNLKKINPDIKYFQFDEGVGTLVGGSLSLSGSSLKYRICKFFNRCIPSKKDITAIYLAAPRWKFFEDGINIRKIAFPFKNERFMEIAKNIYEFDFASIQKYKVYILQSCDIEKDYLYYKEAINHFGKENLLVKLHPRENGAEYEKEGVDVVRGSIPWELMSMGIENLDDKILIAVSSGSLINTKIILQSHCKVIFLYKLDLGYAKEAVFENGKFVPFMNKMKEEFPNEIFVPETIEEYTQLLDTLSKEN